LWSNHKPPFVNLFVKMFIHTVGCRKDSEQTKQIEELQQKNEDLAEEKERLLEEIERIVSDPNT
jgi:cell division protein FtsB